MRESLSFYIDGQWVDPVRAATSSRWSIPQPKKAFGRVSLGRCSGRRPRGHGCAGTAFATYADDIESGTRGPLGRR